MHVVRTLWPGSAGTLAAGQHYGAALVCLRYRQDASGIIRHKTVELVVESRPVRIRVRDDRLYGVQVWWGEDALARRVKAAGGRWSKDDKLWLVDGAAIKAMRLQNRIRLRCA
jgi:hypothetical protein